MTRPMTDAATATVERARSMPLSPVDRPAAVIRALEDAALARIDAAAARRFADLDRRFDRAVSALRQELARRQDHADEETVRRPATGWDATGFLLSLAAAPVLLATRPTGPAFPAAVAVPFVVALIVLATAAHLAGAVRASRQGASVASTRYLVLLSGLPALAVAALVAWRSDAGGAGGVDVGVIVSVGLSVAAATTCVVLFARAAREARVESDERRTARDAERARRSDLEVRLAEVIESARAESWEILGSLTSPQRDELRSATNSGVAALGRRELLEPAVLRELRTTDLGQLRYAVDL